MFWCWVALVFEPMATHTAIVLAAGKGSRMKSQNPKVLHRVCGVEMIRLVVGTARQAGLDPIVVVVADDSRTIRDALDGDVSYIVQHEPLGSGHAVLRAVNSFAGLETVVVLSGDVPLVRSDTIQHMIRVHMEREAGVTLLTSKPVDTDGLGRVVRSSSGGITAIVEESEADLTTLGINEINGGVYCFRGAWLAKSLGMLPKSSNGEILLTDAIALASRQGIPIESVQSKDPSETLGVNTRIQLAEAEGALRHRILERWMLHGVTIQDPASAYIDADVELGQDTAVLPNTHITGRSLIGSNCRIGPNSIVRDSTIGDSCNIVASVVEGARLDQCVEVGPSSHIRPGSHLEEGVHIGNYAEVKNSRLGPGTKSGHFSYIGDAELGANVNIGAGVVTCNYDGENKNRTVIGDDAFIGSDSMLIAPVTIGARSSTGAGSVVSKDVPPDSLAVGAPARVLRKGKRRSRGPIDTPEVRKGHTLAGN